MQSVGYKFGFNGMEMDNHKGSGNSYTTPFRQYDPRLGRWLTQDPIIHPWSSPFAAFNNNPVYFIDPSGLSGTNSKEKTKSTNPAPSGKGTKDDPKYTKGNITEGTHQIEDVVIVAQSSKKSTSESTRPVGGVNVQNRIYWDKQPKGKIEELISTIPKSPNEGVNINVGIDYSKGEFSLGVNSKKEVSVGSKNMGIKVGDGKASINFGGYKPIIATEDDSYGGNFFDVVEVGEVTGHIDVLSNLNYKDEQGNETNSLVKTIVFYRISEVTIAFMNYTSIELRDGNYELIYSAVAKGTKVGLGGTLVKELKKIGGKVKLNLDIKVLSEFKTLYKKKGY